MNQQELIPHLFRTEFSRITSVLCRRFGIEHMEAAEDIASDTFLRAAETWAYNGIPENPVAWLYTVAKNIARNHLHRDKLFHEKIAHHVKAQSEAPSPEIDLSAPNISDSQLQMLFTLCHPCIPAEAQIGLSLRVLCGFGIEEIATAFLTNKETINKRLLRAREKLRQEKVKIELPTREETDKRLDTVLTTLYLLFNEGYYSESNNAVLREDLCLEAMRLTNLLLENERTNRPPVNALLALMCFHASRFEARKNSAGEIILYADQDEALWNKELIARGAFLLKQGSQGKEISRYHLEANIAYWHTVKSDSGEKWEAILELYNKLLVVAYSPVAALNRTFALSKARGKQVAIVEAEKLKLEDNHYYFTLLGELYRDSDPKKSREHFEKAHSLARTQADKLTIQKKIDSL